MGAPEGTDAYTYATALRKALDGYLAGGGTQAAIAKALSTSTASVSRYLSGERIAPREKLHALKAYLEAQSLPFPDGVWAELDELCGKAHLASGAAAVQRDHLKEELARACAEHQRAQWSAKQQLHGLEQRADRLTEDLRQALARAQSAERTRRILQERVTVQDRSLRKAGDYIRSIEGELAQQKEQTGPLLTEVGVLREQNRRLVEEKPAVAAPATQLSHPATPQYVYVTLPPSPTLETAAATAEPVEAASPPQWVTPQERPDAGPAEPYGTAPLPQQDQCDYEPYGYGYWTPDQPTYDALFAGTQPAPHGYQEDATTGTYRPHDAYGYAYEAWAAAPYDTGAYGAWGLEQWAAGPLPATVDGEPSLHTPAAPPAPLPHREDEEARQPDRAARPDRTAPPHGRAGALPTLALLAVLLGARLA
ncbi:hypothetical protein AB0D29_35945 [Streptomyces sp. NPDC048424]|uniref:hypothetical protein n=1 Tax=Streptomyces sp. NPDC048424 TaxID=3155265 RepID=UPI003446E8D2